MDFPQREDEGLHKHHQIETDLFAGGNHGLTSSDRVAKKHVEIRHCTLEGVGVFSRRDPVQIDALRSRHNQDSVHTGRHKTIKINVIYVHYKLKRAELTSCVGK